MADSAHSPMTAQESTSLPVGVREMVESVRAEFAAQKSQTKATLGTVAPLPFPDTPTFTWGGYWHGIGVMFLLLAGLWLLARLLKRYGRFSFLPRQGSLPRDALYMEAQMPIGPRKCLVVVRFLNKRLLLGMTEQQVVLLTEERVNDGVDESDFEAYMDKSGEPSQKTNS